MQTSAVSPDEAKRMLREGHCRYMSETPEHPHVGREQRKLTCTGGQHPFAAILACADSRVPVELIFDQGIGDLFDVRVAGNVVGPSERGSLEYAVTHLGTPLVLILGHSDCGAVKAVYQEGLLGGNLRPLAEKIVAAVEEVKRKRNESTGPVDWTGMSEASLIDEAARINVWNAIEDFLITSGEPVSELVRSGACSVEGAFYDLDTGDVEWMGEHPRQAELLRL